MVDSCWANEHQWTMIMFDQHWLAIVTYDYNWWLIIMNHHWLLLIDYQFTMINQLADDWQPTMNKHSSHIRQPIHIPVTIRNPCDLHQLTTLRSVAVQQHQLSTSPCGSRTPRSAFGLSCREDEQLSPSCHAKPERNGWWMVGWNNFNKLIGQVIYPTDHSLVDWFNNSWVYQV